MDIVVSKYYEGFAGYPEIQFIRDLKDGRKEILSLWIGYFDLIMYTIEPKENFWTGIAYYYHVDEPWLEESPWRIPDISTVVGQFKDVNINKLDNKAQEVLKDIIELLLKAQANEETVWIAYN